MKKTCETCKHRGAPINTEKNLYWCECGKTCVKGSAWEEKGKESICRNCFHSYVCELFNENKDDNNEKCHFANDHYIPRADVVPKSEVKKIFEKLKERECSNSVCAWCVHASAYGRRNEECDKPYIDKNGKEQKACYVYAKFENLIDNELAELKKKYTGEKL